MENRSTGNKQLSTDAMRRSIWQQYIDMEIYAFFLLLIDSVAYAILFWGPYS